MQATEGSPTIPEVAAGPAKPVQQVQLEEDPSVDRLLQDIDSSEARRNLRVGGRFKLRTTILLALFGILLASHFFVSGLLPVGL